MPAASDVQLLCILAASAVFAVSLRGLRPFLDGTTLLAAWRWAKLSFALVVGSEIALRLGIFPGWESRLRFAAAITSLAPFLTVLGAKRPQQRAWQAVVITLLGMLLLMGLGGSALRHSDAPSLHAIWQWLLAILIAASCINYLFTRFAVSAVLVAIGQWLLLVTYLPAGAASPARPTVALCVAAVAALIAWRQALRSAAPTEPLQRLWLDFRDAYGLLWAVRVADRCNRSAAQQGYSVHLNWSGFASTLTSSPQVEAALTPTLAGRPQSATEHAARTHLFPLLARFVSETWIQRRLGAA